MRCSRNASFLLPPETGPPPNSCASLRTRRQHPALHSVRTLLTYLLNVVLLEGHGIRLVFAHLSPRLELDLALVPIGVESNVYRNAPGNVVGQADPIDAAFEAQPECDHAQ